jgi:hypothetical protein
MLEKSADGIRFFEVAHISGSGTSNSRKDYFFEDIHPFADLSFYRITAVDFDGYHETFHKNVVSVKSAIEKNFKVFPNPVANGQITAKINFDGPANTEVHIYNCLGTLLRRHELTSHETLIAVTELENGVYFAKLSSAQFSHIVRFVVLKN